MDNSDFFFQQESSSLLSISTMVYKTPFDDCGYQLYLITTITGNGKWSVTCLYVRTAKQNQI